jgi:hypothetical protein
MMNEFEKYVKQHRAEFDEFKADSSKLWEGISSKLDEPKAPVIQIWRKSIFKIAASFIILLGVSGIIGYNLNSNSTSQQGFASKELNEIDSYYSKMVNVQVKMIERNTKLTIEDKIEFLKFMDELDEEYQDLLIDLGDNLNNERVLAAIVDNYRKRIELIENLLKQINDSKEISDENAYVL